MVKKQLNKKELYTPIINAFKETTNLTDISNRLSISKQNLNNYLHNLTEKGYLVHKGKGWYELTEKSKLSTKYDEFLPKDFIRGHAYVWNIKLPKEIKHWDKRIEILKSKGINFNLVGALRDIPRIKILNRKIWLCKDHLRIFDKKDSSYYGSNSIEARTKALNEVFLIVGALERKLGVLIRPLDIEWKKEHYALIKNDLAIENNRKGVIMRISDELGEWLLVDDSLEKGGELENVGKKSFIINPKMQKWWNENKETNFEVTPKFLMEAIKNLVQIQITKDNEIKELRQDLNYVAQNQISHVRLIEKASKVMDKLDKKLSKDKPRITKDKFQRTLF